MFNWKRALAVTGVGLALCSFPIDDAHGAEGDPVAILDGVCGPGTWSAGGGPSVPGDPSTCPTTTVATTVPPQVLSSPVYVAGEATILPACDIFGPEDGDQQIPGAVISGRFTDYEGGTIREIHGNTAEGNVSAFAPADGRAFQNYVRYVPNGPAEQTVYVQIDTFGPDGVVVETAQVWNEVTLTPATFASCNVPVPTPPTTQPGPATTPPVRPTSHVHVEATTPTTTPATLPETGSSNSSVALGGLLLLAVGLGAVLIGAFARRPGDQPTL